MFKTFLAAVLCLMFTVPAFAKIDVEPCNYDGTVRYRSSKRVDRMATNDTFWFLKISYPDNSAKYFIRIDRRGTAKLMKNDCIVTVNDTQFTLPRYILPQSPNWKMTIGRGEICFEVPDNMLGAIKTAKTMSISVCDADTDKAIKLTVPQENLEEFNRMFTLNYADYENYKKINP